MTDESWSPGPEVGLAVSHNEGPMQFAAIIPMLDPPRGDTKLTIHRIREAGINVKMITGGAPS